MSVKTGDDKKQIDRKLLSLCREELLLQNGNPSVSGALDRMIHPRSLALVGASNNPGKFGWLYPKALMDIGYGGRFYPINRNAGEILGHRTYPSLESLPEVPDLLVVSVPASSVSGYMEEALELGIPGAVIMSAGFAELDGDGERMEEELKSITQKGIRIIGPNCFGIYSPGNGLTFLPGGGFSREEGQVGFFAQSGGFSSDLCQMAIGRGVRFSAAISYGNGVDVDEADLLEYFAHDKKTKIIAAYIEGVKRGRRFFELLKEITPKKPVVIWKAGMTPAGRQAVVGHTGSMGGEEAIWEGVFRQTGVVSVMGLEDMLDTLAAFTYVYPRGGKNISIIGGGGAVVVESSDLADKAGLRFPPFPEAVEKKIGEFLQGAGSNPKNPIDSGNPLVYPGAILEIMEVIAGLDEIDVILVVQFLYHIQVLMRSMSGQHDMPLHKFAYYPELSKGIGRIVETYKKPIIGVFPYTGTSDSDEDLELEGEFRRAGKAFLGVGAPVYPTMERAIKALSRVVGYKEFLKGTVV